jgi:NAD+ kinase
MKIAIHSSELTCDLYPLLRRLFAFFEKNQIVPVVNSKFFADFNSELNLEKTEVQVYQPYSSLPDGIDLMLSIGGDGTFLDAASLTYKTGIPLAGINCGRLGFLADIAITDIEQALNQFIEGAYTVEFRSALELIDPKGVFGENRFALNELTVQKRDNSSMITIETSINNQFLANYWADGMIVATPTGSTAYSLSVGGPIMTPQLRGLLLTPIASHLLTVRPIVVPEDVEIQLKIMGRGQQFMVSVDHHSALLDFDTILRIRVCEYKLPVIRLSGHNFYKTLRNKLMWGLDRRN